jgi:hypothetical protein
MSQSQLVEEFIDGRGWKPIQVAAKMSEIVSPYQQSHPAQKAQLVEVGASTLSRWKNKGGDKCVNRPKFNAVVLAVLHLEWEASEERGDQPCLQDVAAEWNEWHGRSSRPTGADAPDFLEPEQLETEDLSDREQVRLGKTYGTTGAELLRAARAGDGPAAFDLGLLRALDGHRAEGASWLRLALAAGERKAAPVLDMVGSPGKPVTAAVQPALDRASHLKADPRGGQLRILLLESTARTGSKEAAAALAELYEHIGESGSAERWRRAANRTRE